jgi:outer membrane lipoprotein SlyB
MGHDDRDMDPGHGEPGHVHDEHWTKQNMRIDKDTDLPTRSGDTWSSDTTTTGRTVRTDDTALENEEGGGEAIGAGAGALGGAAVGMAVGGPPGAVVGGAIGAVGGAVAGEAAEGDDEAGSGAGGLAGGVAGAAVGGAIAGPPGAVVGGAVGAAGGAGVGDQAEEEAEETDTVDTTKRTSY